PENVVYFNDLREKGNVIGHSSGVRVELAYATSDDGKPGAKVRLTNMTEATRRYMCGYSTYNDDLVTMINMALPNMPVMLGPGESTEAFINQSSFTAFSMQVRIVD
ncbi:MAG: hypothetical protein IJM69_09935, partial [Firmicutes bacterium]|nr:hypothetical protein [Bacillota bacterium]